MGRKSKTEGMCVNTQRIHLAVEQKLTQHGKAATPQQRLVIEERETEEGEHDGESGAGPLCGKRGQIQETKPL